MSKNRESSILRIQQVAVGLGVFIMLAKFAAYYFTRSNTILTDALEGMVNIIAGSFAVYSLVLSSKPKDIDHPYGHGKIEFISTGFEGGLIVLASILIIAKSIFSFFHPEQIHHLEFGILLVVISGIANYLIGYLLVRKAKQYNSLVLDADGKHLKADGYISFAIVLGVAVIWLTGIRELDNIFAITAGVFIAYTGIKLMRRSLSGIMDETDTGIITSIIGYLNTHRRADWIDVHNMREIQYGSALHVDCHVTLPWYYTLEEAHTEIDTIAKLINQSSPFPVEVFIHPDPCLPVCCPLCQIAECKVRQHPFEKKVEWTFANVTQNRKHQLEEAPKPPKGA